MEIPITVSTLKTAMLSVSFPVRLKQTESNSGFFDKVIRHSKNKSIFGPEHILVSRSPKTAHIDGQIPSSIVKRMVSSSQSG